MDFYVAIGLDLAAVAIVGYCIYAAAKKGFLRTVIQMVAYVAVILAASFLSNAAAPVIYDRVVEPMLLEEHQGGAALPQGAPSNAALVSMAPPGLLAAGGALDGVLDSLEGLLPEDFDPEAVADGLIDDLADATIRPLMISAIRMIGFVVLFALLSMLANCLLSALGIINYLPVVGTVNGLLGAAVGALQGILLVWILAILLQGLLHIYPEGWWVFTQDAVGQSYVFKYFMDFDWLRQLYA
ncbi:MAG: CvpA family protein [Anaerotruncus rubiinfantis]|jgi:uncharacterized membrane protein required for colicin V production|uniref:CvpA family protein n=1 Tax=Anaerotruncus rubiinfantis TaxID=1720200 RepID=UPI001897BCB8|nr:CvpA family protein [Anaerotruncus rubiinfantis]